MTMKQARKSLDEIVREARALGPDDQASFIREACAADQALYESVTREIASSPGWADLNVSESFVGDTPDPSLVGERVGPYRVLRMLGEGGMGAVFLAERDDGQFEQRVAIKLVRRGLLSRNVQNRLRIERQILATLDHPNIAKLLDGGTTPDGTPYIVMEYIDGEPIDTYCDRNGLNINERLQLFRTVCSAVHAAHRNLIVHRDLKPSNILVSRNGAPKLLDFGIAKLLDERHLLQTLAVTHADVRLMTPDHASPEQVRGDPITTASDVYVLAILLYELLTGLKPFGKAALRLTDLERSICEEPPVVPSGALVPSTRIAESDLMDIAARRGTTLPRLRRELRGDLDNIILVGLRKEPERRYSSVESFSDDIDRYLKRLPVEARADAWTYRLSKFVRRHFIVVGLTTAFVISLIAFSITTYVQARAIERERDVAAHQRAVAEMQREHAESISAFMIESFKVSDPSEARGNEIKAREILDRGALRVRTELKNQPALQASVMHTIGTVYLALGLPREAESLIEESLTIRRQLFGNRHPSVAESLTDYADVQRYKGDWDQAQRLAEEALSIARELTGDDSLESARSILNLGMVHYERGEIDSAERLLRQSLEIYEAHLGEEDRQLTNVLDMLGRTAQARGNVAEAERLLTRALSIERDQSGIDHPLTIQRQHNLAAFLWSKGELDAAEREFRQVVGQYERILGPDHPETIDSISSLAAVLATRERWGEARQLHMKALELNRATRGQRHAAVAYDLTGLALVSLGQSRLPEAERYAREAIGIYRETLDPGHPDTAAALTTLGRILIERKDLTRAEPALEEALTTFAAYGEESAPYAIASSALARVWMLQGKLLDAEPKLRHSYTVLYRARGPDNEATRRVRGWVTQLYAELKRPETAAALFESVARGAQR